MQSLIDKLGLGEGSMSFALWIGLSIILLVLVMALAIWLVRLLRPSLNMGAGHGRGGRPQRLAITDAFTLDREGRRLVIVRRDNTEHLLLIGGPNDVVVECNISRSERAQRDRGAVRGADAETTHAAEATLIGELARTEVPPAPVAPQVPPPRPAPAVAAASAPSRVPQPPAFKPRVAPQVVNAPAPAVPQQLDEDFEKALSAMQMAQQQQAEARQAQSDPRPATGAPNPAPARVAAPPMQAMQHQVSQPVAAPKVDAPAMLSPPAPPPERPARAEPVSDMARRLNEVLQKPLSGQLRPPFNKPITPAQPAPMPLPAAPVPLPEAPALTPLPMDPELLPQLPDAAASAAPPKAASTPDSEMDMLEEEMARLLGRPAPSGKSGNP